MSSAATLAELRRRLRQVERSDRRTAFPPRAQEPAELPAMSSDQRQRHRSGCDQVVFPDAATLTRLGDVLAIEARRCGGPPCPSPPTPDQVLFIDTETTGLSRGAGTLAFLIGIGGFWGEGGRLQVDQLFVPDPGDERDILEQLAARLDRARVLVSYNGRGFDLPLLRNRGLLNRLRLRLDQPHIDLLHLCRRHFRARLSNCRLTTVERELLGIHRVDDIPGADIPQRYIDFLHHGRRETLDGVFEHNRLDIVALWQILERALQHLSQPLTWAEDAHELFATGRYLLRWGDAALGHRCLERALEISRDRELRRRLLTALARSASRTDPLRSGDLWQRYAEEFPQDNQGWIALARHHERVTGDLHQALACTDAAPERDFGVERRRARLQSRLARIQATPQDA